MDTPTCPAEHPSHSTTGNDRATLERRLSAQVKRPRHNGTAPHLTERGCLLIQTSEGSKGFAQDQVMSQIPCLAVSGQRRDCARRATRSDRGAPHLGLRTLRQTSFSSSVFLPLTVTVPLHA